MNFGLCIDHRQIVLWIFSMISRWRVPRFHVVIDRQLRSMTFLVDVREEKASSDVSTLISSMWIVSSTRSNQIFNALTKTNFIFEARDRQEKKDAYIILTLRPSKINSVVVIRRLKLFVIKNVVHASVASCFTNKKTIHRQIWYSFILAWLNHWPLFYINLSTVFSTHLSFSWTDGFSCFLHGQTGGKVSLRFYVVIGPRHTSSYI